MCNYGTGKMVRKKKRKKIVTREIASFVIEVYERSESSDRPKVKRLGVEIQK